MSLLCVANFPSNTGYAWDFIESLYARVADQLAMQGVRTFVAYPQIPAAPRALHGSSAIPVVLDAALTTHRSSAATAEFIRRENVRVVYLADRTPWNPSFLRLRWAGARQIVVHDHTSGERTPPHGLRRLAKWLLARAPALNADTVVAVSDYVAHRQVTAGLVPGDRVLRVWNGIPIPPEADDGAANVRGELGLDGRTPLVLCVCRANPVKGVEHLLRAFDMAMRRIGALLPTPHLVYVGDGPQLQELQAILESSRFKDNIHFTGYRSDVSRFLRSADVCVVPSLWHEAFALSVLEPMAMGKPVIASNVGGVPELVEDARTGLLVPPGDEAALAAAMMELLGDASKARKFGQAARARAAQHFGPENQISSLVKILGKGFGIGPSISPLSAAEEFHKAG